MIEDKDLRQEVVDKGAEKESAKHALSYLAAYMVTAGDVSWSAKGIKVSFSLYTSQAALSVAACLEYLYDYRTEITMMRPHDHRRRKQYVLELSEKVSDRLLTDCRMVRYHEDVPTYKLGLASLTWVEDRCYFAALYLQAGRLYTSGGDYRLDLEVPRIEQRIAEIQRALGRYALRAYIRQGRENVTFTLRRTAVADLAGLMGASVCSLEISGFYVEKDANKLVNRTTNCYASNVDKTISAAAFQVWAITLLEEKGELQRFDPEVREVAAMRLLHTDMPLSAIADKLGSNKSTVYHRMKKLTDKAQQLRGE